MTNSYVDLFNDICQNLGITRGVLGKHLGVDEGLLLEWEHKTRVPTQKQRDKVLKLHKKAMENVDSIQDIIEEVVLIDGSIKGIIHRLYRMIKHGSNHKL